MASSRTLKVAVIGPKGQCGSCVVHELLSRGHDVTGISRDPPKAWQHTTKGTYRGTAADINDLACFSRTLGDGYDAIVCAYGPPLNDLNKMYQICVEGHCRIKEALLASSHQGRFIIVGGAGSLHNKQGISFADEANFVYDQWYAWPEQHINYMYCRAIDHNAKSFARFIWLFWWARSNVESPGWFSWLLRPVAKAVLRWSKRMLTSPEIQGLITGSRVALRLYEGVRDKNWSFLSPPWLLRDKGVRTGKYAVYEDTATDPAYQALEEGIYNEDMAAAIVDEVENGNLDYKHWTCTGPIGLRDW